MGSARHSLGAIALLALASACTSQVDGAATSDSGAASGSGGASSNSSTVGYTTGNTTGSGGGAAAPGDPEVVTRVARLTHDQYNATVQDLLGVTDMPADAFAPDALNGFDFETSINLQVDARLGPQYRAAAESLAERAASDPAVFEKIVPCSTTDEGCAGAFIESFGQRAFRRPLGADEAARFMALFEQGETLVASGDAFRDGVRLVVEAMLQSPQFLYRTELSTQTDSAGLIPLSSWEIATRLSYFVLGSMPTEDLFDRANRDELRTPEQIASAVQTLLESDRATAQLIAFHAQAWDFGRFSRIAPDLQTYPDAPDDIVGSTRLASELFVQDVIETGGGLGELLTAPFAYADDGLARLYGVNGSGAMTKITLDPNQRKGYLMQVGYLASHAHAVATDPIHRGLFIVRELLCRTIPDPPPGASMTPLPETDEPIETTREEVELLTGQTGCTSCHNTINPPGFAFEGFDAVGRLRTTENGVPVDTSGTMKLDGADLAFSGPIELVDALAASAEARACYASKWLEFAYGRALGANDAAVADALADSPLGIRELVAGVSATDAFVNRKPNEVAP